MSYNLGFSFQNYHRSINCKPTCTNITSNWVTSQTTRILRPEVAANRILHVMNFPIMILTPLSFMWLKLTFTKFLFPAKHRRVLLQDWVPFTKGFNVYETQDVGQYAMNVSSANLYLMNFIDFNLTRLIDFHGLDVKRKHSVVFSS